MSAPNSILVIRLSSLGDVLMTMPAVKALKDGLDNTRISWLVEGSVSEFLAYQPFIDDVILFPRQSIVRAFKKGKPLGLTQEIKTFIGELREKKYDLIIDFHGIIKSAILSTLVRGKKTIGFSKLYAKEKSHLFYHEKIEGKDKSIHKVERNMLIPKALGIYDRPPEVIPVIPSHVNEYIEKFFLDYGIGQPVFALNPFSSKGSKFKRWDLERYADLAQKIRETYRGSVLILWGPGEKKEAEYLKKIGGDRVFLSCPTTIPQLFALLKRVKMYIGGDTGVMHLASMAKVPVVAIFGPTDVSVNAPYGSNHMIVRKPLPCSPCKKKDCKERKCLDEIKVDDVFEVVRELMKRRNS
jgi:lipopolysaccharide heptosyltransferase I